MTHGHEGALSPAATVDSYPASNSASDFRSDASRAGTDTQRLIGLQWGRGIAALSVVITHAIAYPFTGAPGISHLLGRFGVTLFFIISGFIMVSTTGSGRFNPLQFMWRRILRIVPMYYIATGLTVLGVLIAPHDFKNTVFNVPHLILSLLFIPSYEPNGSGYIWPILRLGWTLNFEMFFYVCFASLFAFQAQTRAIVLSIVFGALILVGLNYDFEAAIPHFYTQIDILGFVAGVWLAILAARVNLRVSTRNAVISCVLEAISLGLMAFYYEEIKDNPWTQVWLVISCAHLVGLLAAASIKSPSRALNWLTFAGDASYSMYLFHMFAVAAATLLAARFLGHWGLYLGMLLAAIGGTSIGAVLYFYVESPLNRLLRGKRRPARMKQAPEITNKTVLG